MSNFHVGQKVVCIRGYDEDDREEWETLPIEGGVYTVRSIDAPDGIYLCEILNEAAQYIDSYGEVSFHQHRFRPVVERKTSIEVFTKLLHTNRTRQPA